MSAVRYWNINHRFHVSDYVAPPVGSSWVLSKHSPLIHPLNKIIQGHFQTGLGGFYADEYVKEIALKSRAYAQASTKADDLFEINTNYRETELKEKPLEFVNLYASFMILFLGSAGAVVILVVEKIRFNSSRVKWWRKRQAKLVQWRDEFQSVMQYCCTPEVILGRFYDKENGFRSRRSWTHVSCVGSETEALRC